jgi:hypothetical protein
VVFYDTTRPLYLKTRPKTLSGSGSAKTVAEAARDSLVLDRSVPIMAAFLGINPYKEKAPPLAVQPFPYHDHPAVKATVFELDFPVNGEEDAINELMDSSDDIGNVNPRSSFLQKNPLTKQTSTITGGPVSNPLVGGTNPMTSPVSRGFKSVDKFGVGGGPVNNGLGNITETVEAHKPTRTKHQYRRTSALETSIVNPKLAEPRSKIFQGSFREEDEHGDISFLGMHDGVTEDVRASSARAASVGRSSNDESEFDSQGVKKSSYFSGGGGEHGRVVILWNECVQQFGPNSEQWAMYGLGDLTGPAKAAGLKAASRSLNRATQASTMEMAMSSSLAASMQSEGKGKTVRSAESYKAEGAYHTQAALQASQVAASSGIALYIIIDPLSNGLYRIRLYSGDRTAFSPGTLGPHSINHSMLGPLSHGMVVPASLLGPLVRQTAINGAKRLLGLKRRRQDITKANKSNPTNMADVLGAAGTGADFDRWCCPYDARVKALSVLKVMKKPVMGCKIV